ncbi:MAG: phosphoribosylaminoimidazolesuccinocarboxamide synthase [bacterium]|nr:phosphoribosylaminoimidazolesuccinocarboxamide synthase [bacterium]
MSILPIKLLNQGKVRDVYDLDDKLLIVTSDRISAFDHILPTPIVNKGKFLTKLSVFWFDKLKEVVPTHFISADVDQYPKELHAYKEELAGRSMLVKKAERIDIECIVRGYIAGSGLKEYQDSGTVCSISLPEGFLNSSKLPEPIFTPSTKAEVGDHDVNISEAEAVKIIGQATFNILKEKSLALYNSAADYALTKGIIIADTKFEFGVVDGEIIVIDEVLTPDSSRFWNVSTYQSGKSQDSYDKQIVRDYLEKDLKWDKNLPVPELPKKIVDKTVAKYQEVCDLLIK